MCRIFNIRRVFLWENTLLLRERMITDERT